MSDLEAKDPFYSLPEHYIETAERFEEFIAEVDSQGFYECCSIDTEADSMHSYETKLCLIQFSLPSMLAIIDPLSIGKEGMSRFPEFIDRFGTVWMHGADYDISMFEMTFGWVPRRIDDTQIAARLLGVPKFGLANLLEEEYGIKVSKQSQKADWSRRPLSEKMLAYAYNDVRYLLDLGEKFVQQLKECGRYEWFVESCDAARTSVLGRDGKSEDEVWRISGWGKLSRRGLNYLLHLWLWRDSECKKLDRPAFKFLSNQEILRMSISLDENGSAKPPHYLKERHVRRMNVAIDEVRQVPESEFPSKRLKATGPRLDIDEARFEKIRAFRNQAADSLKVDSTMIATRSIMERLASKNLSDPERLQGLQDWQRTILLPVLEEVGVS